MNLKKVIPISALFALLATTYVSCDSPRADWGFQAISGMKTPPDPTFQCPLQIPTVKPLAQKRADCSFKANSRVSETLGISPEISKAIPIRHVIIMMKENRSFDHIFGKLHDQGQENLLSPVSSAFTNLDLNGKSVTPFHAPTTCINIDPTHQSASMIAGVNGGAMDGFVSHAASTGPSDGHFVMSSYESTDLPFYYWLANTYALNDRHFAPMQTGTFAVRNFMMFGTNAKVIDTGIAFPDPDLHSIFRELMNAKYTWGVYSDGGPLSGTLDWQAGDPGVYSMRDLFDTLANKNGKTLPNVVFVDGREDKEDDHPVGDLQAGEAWSRKIYQAAIQSPQWESTAIIWTYDEGGGFADHIPPPKACAAKPGDDSKLMTNFGPRVPLVVISPWAKRHYVSHVEHDHTAITRFIEAIFDLPALTARDANSDALFDMFDFSCEQKKLTPPGPAPEAGTKGCNPNQPWPNTSST